MDLSICFRVCKVRVLCFISCVCVRVCAGACVCVTHQRQQDVRGQVTIHNYLITLDMQPISFAEKSVFPAIIKYL